MLFYEHLTPNHDNPLLADKRMRQALMYALDRDALTQQLFGGRQEVALTNINPLDWIFTDKVRTYTHDPAQAAALLDAAGWTMGTDGLRHDVDGKPLTFELMSTAGDRTRLRSGGKELCGLRRDDLQIGVLAQIEFMRPGQLQHLALGDHARGLGQHTQGGH